MGISHKLCCKFFAQLRCVLASASVPAMQVSCYRDHVESTTDYFVFSEMCKWTFLYSLQPRLDQTNSSYENAELDKLRFRHCLTTLTIPRRCIGFARRRVGRGGR